MTQNGAVSPTWGAIQLRRAIDAAGVALWAWNVDDDHLTMRVAKARIFREMRQAEMREQAGNVRAGLHDEQSNGLPIGGLEITDKRIARRTPGLRHTVFGALPVRLA
jgi:hypothetical protein